MVRIHFFVLLEFNHSWMRTGRFRLFSWVLEWRAHKQPHGRFKFGRSILFLKLKTVTLILHVSIKVHLCPKYISKLDLVTVVEGDSKALFSIATTPRSREGCYFFLLIAQLTLGSNLMLSVKQACIKYHLIWIDLGLNLGLPDHWQIFYTSLKNWFFL